MARGRYDDAVPVAEDALAIREKALGPEHPDVASSLSDLADLYRRQRRVADALELSRRAVNILGKRFADGRSGRGTGAAEQRSKRGYMLQNVGLVYIVDQPGAAAESFGVAQLAEVSSAGAAVAAATARLASGGGELAAVVRERQDLAGRWQALDAAIVEAVGKPPSERNPRPRRNCAPRSTRRRTSWRPSMRGSPRASRNIAS
jgi:hypothetical protein